MPEKYFHRILQSEIDQLIADEQDWLFVSENYLQPKWCNHRDALDGPMGCLSLIDTSKNGMRTKISKSYCKTCPMFQHSKK